MYRVEPDPVAMAQIDALPSPALRGYADAVDALEINPWGGEPINKNNPDGAVRQLIFGPDAHGLVTYLVVEDQQRVDVLRVAWTGEDPGGMWVQEVSRG